MTISPSALSHARVVSDPADIREPRSPAQTKIDNDAIVYGHTQGHVIVGGQVLYKVEKLLAQRWKGAQREFLVVWEGDYADADKKSWDAFMDFTERYLEGDDD